MDITFPSTTSLRKSTVHAATTEKQNLNLIQNCVQTEISKNKNSTLT